MTLPGPLRLAMCCAAVLGTTADADEANGKVERYVLFGFGPFAGRQENGSWQSVKQFADGSQIRSIEVPVIWGTPRQKIAEALKLAPGGVILLALGEGGAEYEIETIGYNERGNIRDEAGRSPEEKAIAQGGDARLEVSGRTQALADKLSAAGFPTRTSRDAGRFLCNEMLYELLRAQREDKRISAAYFIHVPLLGSRIRRGTEQVEVTHEYCSAFGRTLVSALRELHPLAETATVSAR